MNRKKFAASLIMLLFLGTHTFAQRSLVVWLKNGSRVAIELEGNPKTTFKGNDLVIESHMYTVSYPTSDVLRYTFESEGTSVKGMSDNTVRVTQSDDVFYISNLKKDSSVELYSADGKLVSKSNSSFISLAGMPAGAYAIKVDGATYKILKR